MTYAIERLFDEIEEKGIEQGIGQGTERGMILLLIEKLSEKFGYVPLDIQTKLQDIHGNKLKEIARNILYLQDLKDIDKWFE